MYAIANRERKVDAFFARAKTINDDEVKSDMARFGIVLICGYVERSVEIIILERLTNRAQPRVLSFIKTHFKRGTNYDCEAICQLLIRFEQEWSNAFRLAIDAHEDWESSLTSAYALRNSIAHGGDGNKGLSGVGVLYGDCKEIISALLRATER